MKRRTTSFAYRFGNADVETVDERLGSVAFAWNQPTRTLPFARTHVGTRGTVSGVSSSYFVTFDVSRMSIGSRYE